jgi:hypothetical protein
MPKNPVRSVSGTKMVATTLTTYARSFSCRSSSIANPFAAASIEASNRLTCSYRRSKY